MKIIGTALTLGLTLAVGGVGLSETHEGSAKSAEEKTGATATTTEDIHSMDEARETTPTADPESEAGTMQDETIVESPTGEMPATESPTGEMPATESMGAESPGVESPSVETTETASPSQNDIRMAQSVLQSQGFDVEVYGQLGDNTKQALRQFQERQGIQTSGELDQRTLSALRQASTTTIPAE